MADVNLEKKDSGLKKEQLLLHSLISKGAAKGVNSLEWKKLARMLAGLSTRRIARLLESNPPEIRQAIWELLDIDREAGVLGHLRDEFRNTVIKGMEPQEVATVVKNMQTDDAADILQKLPDAISNEVLNSISKRDRQRVERVLDYPANTAGGLTNTDALTTRPEFYVDSVLNHLRNRGDLPSNTNQVFVVDRHDNYLGSITLGRLLMSDVNMTVRELMSTDIEPINVMTDSAEVVALFDFHDWLSVAVIDESKKLLGRITIDDVFDVMRKQSDDVVLGRVGLKAAEEDTYAPVKQIILKRMLWLAINLATAFIAVSSIGMFQATLQEVVSLAVLMPIVASMGGIAGTQILTLIERGTARGDIAFHNLLWFIRRELTLSLISGAVFALLVSATVYLWIQDYQIGALLALAIMINLLVATITGVFLPSLLRFLGIDPAVAGSVILTTVTDVVGFVSFLGLATLVYR